MSSSAEKESTGRSKWILWGLSVDLRSLAVARILLGLLMIINAVIRLDDFVFFYTNRGAFPGKTIQEHFSISHVSIFFASGSELWASLCFATMMGSAIAFMLGFRTLPANLVLWFMDVSVQNRCPLLINGGDIVERCLLFWFLFLPSGELLSMDRRSEKSTKHCYYQSNQLAASRTVLGGGSFALTVQLFCIYWFTAMLKTDEKWTSGTAVYYAMQLDFFVKEPFGGLVRGHEILWRPLCHATLLWEWLGPCLLIIPIPFIRTLICFSFIFLHLGFFLGMALGLFPWVCIVYWIAMLPGQFWDSLGWNLRQTEDSTTTAASPATPIRMEAPKIKEHLRAILQDFLPIFLTLYIVLPYNLAQMEEPPYGIQLTDTQILYGRTLRIDQYWNMFSPGPMTKDGWFYLPAVLNNGTQVELWSHGFLNAGPINWATPAEMEQWNVSKPQDKDPNTPLRRISQISRRKPTVVASSIPKNQRWNKLMSNIVLKSKFSDFQLHFGKGVCRLWNRRYKNNSAKLATWQLVFMRHYNQGPGRPETEVEPVLVWNHDCFKKSEDKRETRESTKRTTQVEGIAPQRQLENANLGHNEL